MIPVFLQWFLYWNAYRAFFKHSFSLQKNRAVFIQDNRADIIYGTGSVLSLCIQDKGK